MFKTWTIVESALSKAKLGHYHWEVEAISQELLRRGTGVRILAHNTALASDYPGTELHPIFRVSPFTKIPPDMTDSGQRLDYHNRAFGEAIRRVSRSQLHDGPVLFPTVTEHQFSAIPNWLGGFRPSKRPASVLVVGPLSKWPARDFVAEAYARVWENVPEAVKEALLLCARSEIVADQYHELFGIRPHVLPSPFSPSDDAAPAEKNRADSPMVVSFFGTGRPQKGTTLLPELVRRCAAMPVHFFLQVNTMNHDSATLRDLHNPPQVEVHEGAIARGPYHRLMAKSVVLLPYRPESYHSRPSGIYLEAVCLGV